MAWPPTVVCRRFALFVFGASLMIYLTFSGLLLALGIDVRIALIIAQLTAIFGLALLIAKLLRIPMREAFSLRPAAPVHWAMVLVAAIPLQIAGGALQFTILQTLAEDSPIRRLMEQSMTQFIAVDTNFDLAMLFAAAVLTAAVCEEVLFRGLILQLLRRRAGWGSAIAWSAGLFAVYHLNPVVLLPVALVGAYLAVLVWRSGSIYPAIVAHGLNNGLALFGVPYLIHEATYERHLWTTLMVSSAVLALVLYFYFRISPAPPDVDRDPAVGAAPVDIEGGAKFSTAPHDPAYGPESGPLPPSGRPGGLESNQVDGRLGDGQQAEQAKQSE